MPKKFIFRSNQTIGAAQAELDERYLSQCFVDTGDLELLRDYNDHRRIVAGRTGIGKSALLAQLVETEERVIQIEPESLALTHVANSGVVAFFVEAGVKMDIFYRLLWRHVLIIEIPKERFDINSESAKRSFLDSLWGIVPRNRKYEAALDYLREYGESFWKETEYRVREVTTTLEKQLEGSLSGTALSAAALSVSAGRKLTEEQRQEVVQRAQEVVNHVQIAELARVMELLGEILAADRQKRYFVVIDKLDEDWVEDRIRFRLIRALIETSLDFAKIPNVKVILSARSDLLDRVYRYTRDPGFQEEKHRSITLHISWSKDHLTALLDSRIDLLIRDQYTTRKVTHKDVLPAKIGRQDSIDYILERTLMRPRDVIQFFNTCIQQADGKPEISQKAIRDAEGVYSRERLRALADEWYGLYPNLFHLVDLLKRRPQVFEIEDISKSELEYNGLGLLVTGQAAPGFDLEIMEKFCNEQMTVEDYRLDVVLIFYKVGLIGLKTDRGSTLSWSDGRGISVSKSELSNQTRIQVHKTFWRCLGISDRPKEVDQPVTPDR